ncbi:MAG: DEAD/DEAH box helicase [Pseudomonadota bacterium]
MTFEDLGLSKKLLQGITEMGFETPMPIQEKVIPFILNNKQDLVGLAQTGTGKTAAYGLPLIQEIKTKSETTQVLILCPTRELCMQIAKDLEDFSQYIDNLRILPIFGGASIDKQIMKLRKGVHIIVATPGRLIDLINRKKVNISKIKAVVLDEADEMLNMGFREPINEILEKTPDKKLTYLFSATMPADVAKIASKYMENPEEIKVGKKNVGAQNVHHVCYTVQAKDRYLALKRIADFNPDIYGIIFCRTRRETQEIADQLMQDGYNADSLHGDLSQGQRDHVMNKFRTKTIQMLVATDVAARGLDVDNLTHIINYNLPEDNDVYTHRSGRTGRAGKDGISIVIAHLKEKYKLNQIEKKLDKQFEFKSVPGGKEICSKQLFHFIDKMQKVKIDDEQIDKILPEIYKKLEWLNREDLIKRFVALEFNRFLDYYKNAPDLNPPKDRERGDRNSNQSLYTRFFINVGKKDRISPRDIIGLINDATGIRDIRIGDIKLLETFSFFEADKKYTDIVLVAFKDMVLNKRKISVEIADNKNSHQKNPKRRRN